MCNGFREVPSRGRDAAPSASAAETHVVASLNKAGTAGWQPVGRRSAPTAISALGWPATVRAAMLSCQEIGYRFEPKRNLAKS